LSAGLAELAAATGGADAAGRLPAPLRVQAVEKDGCWFALDSAQLELCRRLERGGVCRQVRVDVVPSRELPANVRNLIRPPPPPPPALVQAQSTAAVPQSSAATTSSSTLPCPVTSSHAAPTCAAASNSHLTTRTSSTCIAFYPD